jgi:DNA-binding XRE family transcriptional regulator
MLAKKEALNLLARKIRGSRNEKKITLERLACENKISKSSLFAIENERCNPNFYTLLRIAGGLNCRVKDLLDF